MSDASWGGKRAAFMQYSQVHAQKGYAQSPFVHPAHGGPEPELFGAPPAYGSAPDARDDFAPAAFDDGTAAATTANGSLVGRAVHGAGALLSLVLIAGLAVWGYKLAMRDVTDVPVVRALEGPMRIQPDDPGGVAAAHQGFAVNAVAAAGQAEGPVPQVTLAPPPVGLAADDAPARSGSVLSAVPGAEADDAPPPTATPDPAPQAASLASETAEDEAMAAALALAEAVAAQAEPLTGEVADPSPAPVPQVQQAAATIPANVPGVSRSPRPAPRPEEIVARAAASPVDLAVASASVAAPASVREVPAADVPAGTRLVQLGAFDSVEVARAEWNKLAGTFGEILEGKDRVIQRAQSGGKTFYRLRAMGFTDLSDARRFCAALMAGQAACIPVVTR